MTWDPSDLQLESADREPAESSGTPGPISNEDRDVKIIVVGAGFGPTGSHFGTFVHSSVRSGKLPEKREIIPCNRIRTIDGNFKLSLRICPRRKVAGKYDLCLWAASPPEVVDDNGNVYTDVPVNNVAYLHDAIEVVEGELRPEPPKPPKPPPAGQDAGN